MAEARFDPTEHKDWLGLAAELEAQGIKIEWPPSGHPRSVPLIAFGYDAVERMFIIRQAAPSAME